MIYVKCPKGEEHALSLNSKRQPIQKRPSPKQGKIATKGGGAKHHKAPLGGEFEGAKSGEINIGIQMVRFLSGYSVVII